MLESNADRSWFTIGAVLVGAVIVAASVVLFPELLSSIGTKLTSMINSVKVPGL